MTNANRMLRPELIYSGFPLGQGFKFGLLLFYMMCTNVSMRSVKASANAVSWLWELKGAERAEVKQKHQKLGRT